VTQTSPSYTINVAKGDGRSYTVGASQDVVKSLDNDIRYIKRDVPTLKKYDDFFWNSTGFWISLILPIVLFGVFLVTMKNEIKKRRDISLMKNRKATRMARKRLAKAKNFLSTKNSDRFYEEISQALWNYLSDKFYIKRADLSMDTVRETLIGNKIKAITVEDLIAMLERCEYARFAPAGKENDLQQVYDSTITLITTIENELK